MDLMIFQAQKMHKYAHVKLTEKAFFCWAQIFSFHLRMIAEFALDLNVIKQEYMSYALLCSVYAFHVINKISFHLSKELP